MKKQLHFRLIFSPVDAEKGQSLIALLFFMVIGITVISAAALIVSADILSASTTEQGVMAYFAAESGAEDGTLRLLRNPTFITTSPYTISTSDGSASVAIQSTISGGTIINTINSVGTSGTTTKKIRVTIGYLNGVHTTTSWEEVAN